MKLRYLVAFVVFIFLLVPTANNGFATDQSPLATKVIVIDPGHGGIYPGACSNGVREATVNLAVALKLRDRLVQTGATVILTRTDDTNLAPPGSSLSEDLKARVDVAKNAGADIFLSLHSNANKDTAVAGVISFYPIGHLDSLARAIEAPLVKATGAVNGGIRPANFYVLRNSEIPAALIEMGFLTNAMEADRLKSDDYQDLLADGLFDGILTYFTVNPTAP